MLLSYSCLVLMQPPIVALGPVSNVSSPIAVNAERPDRILPAVSTSGLVSSFCHAVLSCCSLCRFAKVKETTGTYGRKQNSRC